MALSGNTQTQNKSFPDVIELNVGGQVYYTTHATLICLPDSLLGKMFSPKNNTLRDLTQDPKGRYFIDRDGFLFRYVLDYLRDKQVVLPDHFPEKGRLIKEAEYFQLLDFVRCLSQDELKMEDCNSSDYEDSFLKGPGMCPPLPLAQMNRKSGFLTVRYRGSRQSLPNAKIQRIMICGRVVLAREVFGEALNEIGDPEKTSDRYAARCYLKFTHLERSFDMLSECGFHMVSSNSLVNQRTEEKIWPGYIEYIFYRGTSRSSSCDCCCKGHKGDRESGTSFNDLSTSSSESHSNVSSPQGTIIRGTVSQQIHVQTLEWPSKKVPMQKISHQQSRRHNRSDLLRTLTTSSRDTASCKKQPAKETLTMEEELQKCIQDFHNIKIPETFPHRKYMWQTDLLHKYHL